MWYCRKFTKEAYPYIEDGKNCVESDCVTFKEKTQNYIGANNRLKEKMFQGAELIVNRNRF